jgi:hypothetical protein
VDGRRRRRRQLQRANADTDLARLADASDVLSEAVARLAAAVEQEDAASAAESVTGRHRR